MNAESIRHLFDYHFSQNRKMWDEYVAPLAFEKYKQDEKYSHGSVQNQVIHMVNGDESWFSQLRGVPAVEGFAPAETDSRHALRQRWDEVEQRMRTYLDGLQDDALSTKPIASERNKNLQVWQVLMQVITHGTDHRAQTLRLLNDLGVETGMQDYVIYARQHPG